MTVGYNIHYAHLHWIWHLAIVLPLLFGLLVLLPVVLSELSILKGYADPSHEVLDAMISQSTEFEEDCIFVRNQIRELMHRPELRQHLIGSIKAHKEREQKGRKHFLLGFRGRYGRQVFQQLLGDLKISVSERRLGRMMRFMDRDGDGQVSVLEFLHAIRAGEDFKELEDEVERDLDK